MMTLAGPGRVQRGDDGLPAVAARVRGSGGRRSSASGGGPHGSSPGPVRTRSPSTASSCRPTAVRWVRSTPCGSLALTGQPCQLSAGTGEVYGLWCLSQVEEDRSGLFADAAPRRVAWVLQLLRYGDDVPGGMQGAAGPGCRELRRPAARPRHDDAGRGLGGESSGSGGCGTRSLLVAPGRTHRARCSLRPRPRQMAAAVRRRSSPPPTRPRRGRPALERRRRLRHFAGRGRRGLSRGRR